MREALHYVHSLSVSAVIGGCDAVAPIGENVALARAFTPRASLQTAELTAKARSDHQQALFVRRGDGQPTRWRRQ